MAAFLDEPPPLLQARLEVYDVLQHVAAEDEVDALVGPHGEAGGIWHRHVWIHLDTEEGGILPVVHADEVREGLRRPAADVEAEATGVRYELPEDLSGLIALRIFCAPDHLILPIPNLSLEGHFESKARERLFHLLFSYPRELDTL